MICEHAEIVRIKYSAYSWLRKELQKHVPVPASSVENCINTTSNPPSEGYIQRTLFTNKTVSITSKAPNLQEKPKCSDSMNQCTLHKQLSGGSAIICQPTKNTTLLFNKIMRNVLQTKGCHEIVALNPEVQTDYDSELTLQAEQNKNVVEATLTPLLSFTACVEQILKSCENEEKFDEKDSGTHASRGTGKNSARISHRQDSRPSTSHTALSQQFKSLRSNNIL